MSYIEKVMKEKGLVIPKKETKYPIEEYDKNGNQTHYKNSNGYERWSEDNNKLELIKGKYYLNGKQLKKRRGLILK